MTGRILILGANGRLGFAAAEAFRDAGWSVTGLVRPGTGARAPKGIALLEQGGHDREAITEAARQHDVILHALNPPFAYWDRLVLPMAYVAIDAAEASGATLLFPGNVYNYGADMPECIDEQTPMHPSSRKGRLRVEAEQRIREATDRGMRAIILRAGDFYGGGRGSWFDLVVTKGLTKRRLTYPGSLDVVHEWAYLPDLAAAMVRLADVRATLPPFDTFNFPGHAVTGTELASAVARAVGRGVRMKRMSWWLLKTVGRLFRMGRELSEIAYLWEVPHRLAGDKLQAAIGEVPRTPFEQAVSAALRDLGYQTER
jgi:nucleoside-diphosphate-sugar epimerase